MASDDAGVQAHANATAWLQREPGAGFELAVNEAKRQFTLGKKPRG